MRKIAVVVNSRANYGRVKSVLRAVRNHPDLELQLVLGASALLGRYGSISDIVKRDGFDPVDEVYSIVEGETPLTMAKSAGLGIIELSTVFARLKPDFVVVVADRFEQLSIAIAASYQNIRVAHIQGGEVTGSIDESVRHAITKLSHVHFPATVQAHNRIVQMGEVPRSVFLTGCPSLDGLTHDPFMGFDHSIGMGAKLDPEKPYFVVLQHPVTTEYGNAVEQIEETLKAIRRFNRQTVWLWPNIDAGSDDISKRLRMFHEDNPGFPVRFYRNFPPNVYYNLIDHCACLIGNSSSAIREGSYLGIPAVNIGTRQQHRECAGNVVHADYDHRDIVEKVTDREKSRPQPSWLYGIGRAGEMIATTLATFDCPIQKVFHE